MIISLENLGSGLARWCSDNKLGRDLTRECVRRSHHLRPKDSLPL